MTYTLITCEGENNQRSQRNPSPQMIDQAISALIPKEYHYAILEANPFIDNCPYIQTLIERNGKHEGLYLVEARYLFDGDLRHYRKFLKSVAEVKSIFQLFADGIAPNAAGWEDISRQFTAKTA